jgi:transposase-like protein
MARKPTRSSSDLRPLAHLTCPNEDCSAFNRFDVGNRSVVEWIGKRNDIRRLYCCQCGRRFSERCGTLREYTKVPDETLQCILKCLSHGRSITASADICDVDTRTVQRVLRVPGSGSSGLRSAKNC